MWALIRRCSGKTLLFLNRLLGTIHFNPCDPGFNSQGGISYLNWGLLDSLGPTSLWVPRTCSCIVTVLEQLSPLWAISEPRYPHCGKLQGCRDGEADPFPSTPLHPVSPGLWGSVFSWVESARTAATAAPAFLLTRKLRQLCILRNADLDSEPTL